MGGMISNNCSRFVSSYVKKVLRSELFLSSFYKDKSYSFKVPFDQIIDPSLLNFESIIVEVEYSDLGNELDEFKVVTSSSSPESTLKINLNLSDDDNENSFEEIGSEIEKSLIFEIEHSINVKQKINQLKDRTFNSMSDAFLYYTSEEVSNPVLNEIFSSSRKIDQIETKIDDYVTGVSINLCVSNNDLELQDFSTRLKEWLSYLSYLKFPMNTL